MNRLGAIPGLQQGFGALRFVIGLVCFVVSSILYALYFLVTGNCGSCARKGESWVGYAWGQMVLGLIDIIPCIGSCLQADLDINERGRQYCGYDSNCCSTTAAGFPGYCFQECGINLKFSVPPSREWENIIPPRSSEVIPPPRPSAPPVELDDGA